ncbi:S-adenosylmethionine-dependent methyltransferase [Melia azedarach]|uniref:S-adenosylmethionine-dependent methyltransferase n=1 Tax=Melia azedarach TaxID=155640 RepID=A0ACC1Y0I9_MELAZ|nr:S-adenosylmethionine-dependent methyltransferase [Melia azedarach]
MLGISPEDLLKRAVVDASKELINESISEKLDLQILGFDASNKVVKIADLGCSVGPNTFFAVQNIIEAIELKFQNSSSLEFQVFFNDQSQNDFNTLFRSLPPSRNYFAAGVPGSFYDRLFPKSSLEFAHISNSLHWLSKVPKEVVDRNSPAWNKGSVQCSTGSSKEALRAYSAQFKSDIETFLTARAEEVVPGGLVFVLTAVVPDGIPISQTYAGAFYDVLGSCLNDLVKMGVLSEDKADSFNVPVYNPTPKELEAILKTNKNFNLEKMEELPQSITNAQITPKGFALGGRAAIEGFIKNHFGDEFADQIFNHFITKVEANSSKIQEKKHNHLNMFITLKRVVNCK